MLQPFLWAKSGVRSPAHERINTPAHMAEKSWSHRQPNIGWRKKHGFFTS